VHELRNEPELSLADLLAKLSPADLVIIEASSGTRIRNWIYRAAVGKPLIYPQDDCVVAIASDSALPQAELPVLMLDDIEGIANVLMAEALPRDQIA
jgi:molybdopterin-guanine dinucleotide biosynthesis protein B